MRRSIKVLRVSKCFLLSQYLLNRYELKVKVGVFTAEFRDSVDTCDVLVCTPIIFEILLMAPSCEEWKMGLKYVILDEIHFTNHTNKDKIIIMPSDDPASEGILSTF